MPLRLLSVPLKSMSIMKLLCLAFLLLVVCCQKREFRKHFIAVEIDGKRQRLSEITDFKPREGSSSTLVIYCYYLNNHEEVIKDGEECIYKSYENINNFYKDGSIIESIATGYIP